MDFSISGPHTPVTFLDKYPPPREGEGLSYLPLVRQYFMMLVILSKCFLNDKIDLRKTLANNILRSSSFCYKSDDSV